MSERNDRFKRGTGTYTCEDCGKLTRDTGLGEAGCRLCAYCFEKASAENGLADAETDEARAYYTAELADLRKKYGRTE
jgi:hypothetical protein